MTEQELDGYRAADVGIVLQGAVRNLLPYLTPHQNVGFAQGSARRPDAGCPAPTRCSGWWGSTTPLRRRSARLSPGQLQLAALAVALACRPGLLLGDEPTSSSTTLPRPRPRRAARRQQGGGLDVVVVTRDPDVAARLPRTVTIRDGRVGAEGRSGEEYAVVSADGSLPLPAAAVDEFPPGALVRVRHVDGVWTLIPQGTEAPRMPERRVPEVTEVLGDHSRAGLLGGRRCGPTRTRTSSRRPSRGRRGNGVRYGDTVAVSDAAWFVDAYAGEFIAVTGHSGAGKSSLLWAIAGAVPGRGARSASVTNWSIDRSQGAGLGIEVIPQGSALAVLLTARENLELPLLARGVSAEHTRHRVQTALAGGGPRRSRAATSPRS